MWWWFWCCHLSMYIKKIRITSSPYVSFFTILYFFIPIYFVTENIYLNNKTNTFWYVLFIYEYVTSISSYSYYINVYIKGYIYIYWFWSDITSIYKKLYSLLLFWHCWLAIALWIACDEETKTGFTTIKNFFQLQGQDD